MTDGASGMVQVICKNMNAMPVHVMVLIVGVP